MRRAAAALVLVLVSGCGGSNRTIATTATATTSSSPAATTTATTSSSQPATTTPAAGPAVAELRASTGALTARITGDGRLSTATADRHGGWFVAGSFTELDGDSEHGLAHVLPSGAIDSGWHGALASSGRTALAVSKDTLYAAGSIGDSDRSRLLALDAASGTVRRSLPVPPGPISSLAIDGGRLFVATSTTTSARRPSCLQAIDPQSGGAAGGFAADVRPAPEQGCIVALALDGRWLYLAGAFGAVDGIARPRIARVDATTGSLDTTWSPPTAAIPGTIYDLAIGVQDAFLAGSAPALSELQTATGAARSGWLPPAALSTPLSLAILGDQLLVAGQLHQHDAVLSIKAPDGGLRQTWTLPAGRSAEFISVSGSAALVALGHG